MEMSGSPPFRGNRAYIGLGSNLGDSLGVLRGAAARLAGLGAILAVSPLYETDPVGLEDQPAFLNGVVLLGTTLEPEIGQARFSQAKDAWVKVSGFGQA